MLPGGKEVGTREKGAVEKIRTVDSAEFDGLKAKLLDGATELPPSPGYSGKWYLRHDGTEFGIRDSDGSGFTIDIRKSNSPYLTPGYKVHRK